MPDNREAPTGAAITFLEPLPIGLAVTLLSSAVLRKKAAGSHQAV
jgi:hypothetical protein